MDEEQRRAIVDRANRIDRESYSLRRFTLFTERKGSSRLYYNGRLFLAWLAVIGGLYYGYKTYDAVNEATRNLNLITKVTRVIGTEEDGSVSQEGLQGLLDDLKFNVHVNKGDSLYSPYEYGSPVVEVYLLRNGEKKYLGERNVLDFKSYLGRHPCKIK
jgi:hypothetical protein